MAVDLNGRYTLVSQENLEEYLKALSLDSVMGLGPLLRKPGEVDHLLSGLALHESCINMALRKVVMLLRPEKEFVVDGSHMIIRTLNPFRNYIMDFTVGEEFKEDLSAIDGRVCKTTVSWEDNKLVCVQRGQVPNRGWKQWLEGDLLHVELTAKNVISRQTFRKVT